MARKTTYEWALHYHSLGLSVIPVHYIKPDGACSCRMGDKCDSPGKHPALRWDKYQRERADTDQLAVWFDGSFHNFNIGIVTGQISGNVGVIDVDTGKGKSGMDTLEDLQRDNDDLPPTMLGKTGSGGAHYFYRFPSNIRIRTDKNTLGYGVDTRGEGGFVVAAPSKHKSGGVYEMDDDAIADAPGWLVDLCNDESARELGLGSHGMQGGAANGMFGEMTDGREGYMVRVILGVIRTYVEHHKALPDLDKIIAEGFPIYERKVRARGKSLEADGRGISLFTRRASYQLERAKRGELRVIHNMPLVANGAPVATVIPMPKPKAKEIESGGPFIEDIPQPQVERIEQKRLVIREWGVEHYVGDPPEINWLVENIIPQGVPMLLAAIGGLGKSFIALDLAVKIAAGDDTFHTFTALGGRVINHGQVVFLTAEDSRDSIHRRLTSIADDEIRNRAAGKLFVVPLPDAGGSVPFISESMGGMELTQAYWAVREQLMEFDNLRLIIVDPLQAFVHADVNANPAAAQFWWSSMAELCASTGATLMVTHHMRKEGSFSIKKSMQAREAIRGTTALVDGARLVYGLWNMNDEDEVHVAKALHLQHEPNMVVCGAIVKVNDQADTSVRTFVRDHSGLLVDRTGEVEAALELTQRVSSSQTESIMEEIEKQWNAGNPFSSAAQSRTRYLIPYLMQQLGITKPRAYGLMMDWLRDGRIKEEIYSTNRKQKGLKVMKR